VALPDQDHIFTSLQVGRIIACLRIDAERRESFRGAQLDLDFAPAGVVGLIAWVIPQDILVAQLHTDLRGDVRKGSFRFSTMKARPPVNSVISLSSDGPWSSSGVRVRSSNASKMPIE
jgi:hypothetical protein